MPVFQSNPPLDKRWLGKVCTILTLCATVGLSLNMLAAHIFATWPHDWGTREKQVWNMISNWQQMVPRNEPPYTIQVLDKYTLDFPVFLWIALVLSGLLLLLIFAGGLIGRQHWIWGALPLVLFLILFVIRGHLLPVLETETGVPIVNTENGIPIPFLALCWLIGFIRWQTFWIFAFFWLASAVAAACCILQLWFDRKQKQPARG